MKTTGIMITLIFLVFFVKNNIGPSIAKINPKTELKKNRIS